MKPEHLQGDVVAICMEAATRIVTVGAEQYTYAEKQTFEKETLSQTLDLLEEELQDQINYSAMAIMKLREFRKSMGMDIVA